MSRRVVKHASLHQTAFLQGFGDLSKTLPPTGRTLKLDMFYSPEGIMVELTKDGNVILGLVPWANVATATLGPEVPIQPAYAINCAANQAKQESKPANSPAPVIVKPKKE